MAATAATDPNEIAQKTDCWTILPNLTNFKLKWIMQTIYADKLFKLPSMAALKNETSGLNFNFYYLAAFSYNNVLYLFRGYNPPQTDI